MSSIKGNVVQYSLFGESHGPAIGMTINNLPSGLTIDEDSIRTALSKRSTGGQYASQRRETDSVEWISGVYLGQTTGAPLTFIIRNSDHKSKDYDQLAHIMRPSHADYPAYIKYGGKNDIRGGGMFSGRLTACYVVAGTLVRQLLEAEGLRIKASLVRLGKLTLPFDAADSGTGTWYECLRPEWKKLVTQLLSEVQGKGDSVGGEVAVNVTGMPAGIGEPHFNSVESELAGWLYGIPGMKAVQFGLGIDFAKAHGSQVNDKAYYEDGLVKHKTNFNGGIFGGITNGMDLELKCTFKPTPSIYIRQETIDIREKVNIEHELTGRHDPAFVIRTPIVVESVIAMALYDLMRMAQR